MKQRTGNEIRNLFLEYFKSKGHMIEPGASLIPHNDPTLLWINAGVAALKKYFDGSKKPQNNRISNAQKAIRTNDIENVGKTARHHTFFEMLGNFSIGDYFKEDAITYAWEFLTCEKWIGFPKEKLYISIHTDDLEAYRIWTDICHVDPSHILKTDDNFWEIGEGPGGPNSEIFYDRGEAYDPQGLDEKLFFEEIDNDRYIEVWNIVFSQYDCKPELPRREYKELPQKNIDTGMGLERLVSLVQGGETNFDTDLFLPIIHEIEKIAKYPYGKEYKMAYHVIADHIRTVTFALSDGALFANNGRGYVLRRVLRRAVRFGMKLGIEEAFMYKLIKVVSVNMKSYYPYLMEKIEYNENLVRIEEETFHKTLSNGEKLLNDEIIKAKNNELSGKVVFKLYDTYGFPYELTAEIAEENGLKVNKEVFDIEMKAQKERARAARGESQSMTSQSKDLMDFEKESTFVGYDQLNCEAKVIALFKDGHQVKEISDNGYAIFEQTCFYAESGGQIGDCGYLSKDGLQATISDVRKAPHGQHLHMVELEGFTLQEGNKVNLSVNENKRKRVTSNHSATHLLQSALKNVVGEHIVQAGSFVHEDYLRFDFTHFEKVDEQQLNEIELKVNEFIQNQYSVIVEYLEIEEAKKTKATAVFDEKYGDIVRVVSMGDVSKEFCGGCHVNNTREIGILKITNEESIGSGIRRITAKTGYAAYHDFKEEEMMLRKAAEILKMNSVQGIEEKVKLIVNENNGLKKEMEVLERKALMNQANDILKEAKECDGKTILIKRMDELDGTALKEMAISLRDKMNNAIVFLATSKGGKLVFVSACDMNLVKSGIHCGNLVKEAALICEGNGGGKPELAQAGGKNIAKLDEALKEISLKLGLSL